MRPPLLPVGSVLRSSAAACTTRAVPAGPSSELGPGLRVTALVVVSRPASPDAATSRFGRSPACGPSGFIEPCFLLAGLKWAPAEGKSGGWQEPTAWVCRPG